MIIIASIGERWLTTHELNRRTKTVLRHYAHAMRNYAVFEGRASRAEFWSFVAVFLAATAVILFGEQAFRRGAEEGLGVSGALFMLLHLPPLLAVQARRLHDINWTGWAVLLNAIPAASLFLLVLACLPSTAGPNRYDPKPGSKNNAQPAAPRSSSGRWQQGNALAARGRADESSSETANPQHGAFGSNGGTAPDAGLSSSRQPVGVANERDTIADLERLARLRDAGSLSDDEFRTMKSRIVAVSMPER